MKVPIHIQKRMLNADKTAIDIDESNWTWLNEKYEPTQIKQWISDSIAQYYIPLPLVAPTKKEMQEAFVALCALDATTLITNDIFSTKYDYSISQHQQFIRSSNIGNKSSNYFHFADRMGCNSISSPSPERTWATEKFRLTLLSALWSLKFSQVNTKTLAQIIPLRKYVASQFKPSVAKALYQHFGAKRILDFSAGWGDRLAAFCATETTESYVGIDPNGSLHKNYSAQIQSYQTQKAVTFIAQPAEDVDFQTEVGPVDFIFTSPPYFNIEKYAYDDAQSWVRYKKIDVWNREFFHPVLKKSAEILVQGGHMAINISDVYSGHQRNRICDPMLEFMQSIPEMQFVGMWGMSMAKRPNAKHGTAGVPFGEPIFIWKKTTP